MYYKHENEFKCGDSCIQKFVLTGAESIPDVDVGRKRFALNIILPSSDDTGEIRLVFENVSCVVCGMGLPSLYVVIRSIPWRKSYLARSKLGNSSGDTVCLRIIM